MDILLLSTGAIYLFSFLIIAVSSLSKKNSTFPLIFYFEYFYFFGIAVSPVLVGSGLFNLEIVQRYIGVNGGFSLLTFVHVLFISIGSLAGYFMFAGKKKSQSIKIIEHTKSFKFNQSNAFNLVVLSGLSLFILFNILVGPDIAIGAASEARSGIMDAMGDGIQYAFLKRVIYASVFCTCFLPFLFSSKSPYRIFALLFLLSVSIYLITVARAVFLEVLILGILIYIMREKFSVKTFAATVLVLPLLYFILFYGKTLVADLSQYVFKGQEFKLYNYVESTGGLMDAFFNNFSHLILSIDSGTRHFISNGPLITKDVLTSPFSIFPSRYFELIGLEWLNYQFVDDFDRLPCINTAQIYGYKDSECPIPPYTHGFSAYLFPGVAGFALAFFRFYLHSLFERLWSEDQPANRNTWFFLLVVLWLFNIIYFIPSLLALQVFAIVTFFLAIKSHKFLVTISNRSNF